MLVDRDQRHSLWCRRVPQPFNDTRPRRSHARLWSGLFRLDQLAILGPVGRVFGHPPFLVGPFVDGHNAPALCGLAKDAQDPLRVRANAADQPRLVVVVLRLYQRQPRQNTVARTQGRVRGTGDHQHHGLHAFALPLHRFGKQITILVRPRDLQHRHRRQAVRVLIAALALFQMAFGLQLFQHAFQIDPGRPLDAERLGDVTLGGQSGVFGDPVKDLGL